MLLPGHILQGRYTILSELGRGGMGAVYKATDMRLNISVALKELTAQATLDVTTLQDLRSQFRQEATVLARLNHPNLVGVTDFFQEGENVYLVMQFVEGVSLYNIINQQGALREEQVLIWAHQLLDALSYCHSQGVIHRDIKPQNIIINPSGQAILVDFGLVKLWDPQDPKTRTAVRGIGTPQYAPPEQYETTAGHTEPRSDIYSLGSTLYHALTGQSPPTATLRIASPEEFVSIRKLKSSVSLRTASAIEKAMELARTNRWASPSEMASAFGMQIYAWGDSQSSSETHPIKKESSNTRTRVMPGRDGTDKKKKHVSNWVWVFGIGAFFILIAGGALLITGALAYGIPSNIMAMFNPEITSTVTTINTPTETNTPSNESTSTIEPTNTHTPSPTHTLTASPTPTNQPVPEIAPTHTATAKPSPTPTDTPKPTPTNTPNTEPTSTPTLIPPSTSTFMGFETFGSWKRGDQPYAEFVQSSEQYKGGLYSGKLIYDFPDVPDDFVVFTNIIPISGQPKTFSAYVYGDGSNHYLNMWVQDAGNQIWSVHLGSIPGPGWHKLEGQLAPDLPWPNGHIGGPNNGKVDYPVRFYALVFDRPDTGPRQGIIYIDRLAAE